MLFRSAAPPAGPSREPGATACTRPGRGARPRPWPRPSPRGRRRCGRAPETPHRCRWWPRGTQQASPSIRADRHASAKESRALPGPNLVVAPEGLRQRSREVFFREPVQERRREPLRGEARGELLRPHLRWFLERLGVRLDVTPERLLDLWIARRSVAPGAARARRGTPRRGRPEAARAA